MLIIWTTAIVTTSAKPLLNNTQDKIKMGGAIVIIIWLAAESNQSTIKSKILSLVVLL